MNSIDHFTPANAAIERSGNTESILRYLTIVGLVFLALMLTLKPDVGFTAPLAIRLLFWILQIASGLFILQLVLHLLRCRFGASRAPSWSLVLLSGLLGSVLLAPIYWLIGEGLVEGWLGYPAKQDDESADLFGMTTANPLIQEYFDIVGPVSAAWTLICLPRLHWLMPPLLNERIVTPEVLRAAPEPSPTAHDPPSVQSMASASEKSTQTGMAWIKRLPAELGTDVIAVTSELQYLRVWTPRGCALILGALADIESETVAKGLRVHRSWWVAAEHVVSVRRTTTGAVCLMSDGREVPVSRRRRSEVLARFGGGAQYHVGSASKAVPDSELN